MAVPLVDQLCAIVNKPAPGIEPVSAEMIALARRHRVHLLLADRATVASLAQERREAALVEVLREAELRRMLSALADAGIRPVVFKGAAIARTLYRSPELRVRMDTDLLVPADRSDDAARALLAIGYQRAVETDGDLIASQFHCTRVDRAGLSHALDVHRRISNVIALADVLTYEEVARDAVSLPGLGADAMGPCAIHSLLLACVHRVGHHPDSVDLLWLYDIHLLVARLSAAERARFVELAAERDIRGICAHSLEQAFQAFGGDTREIAARLAASGHEEPTTRLLARRRRPVDLLTADLRTLDRWPQRLQLLRQHLLPHREYMFARYRTRRSFLLPWLYVRRILAGAPKWFRRVDL